MKKKYKDKSFSHFLYLEDDILITKNGPINLSSDAPRKIEVIEELMKQKSLLGEFKLPIIN